MLKRDKEGLYFVSERTGKRYDLDQGYGIAGDERKTSDIIYIIDTGFTEEEYEVHKKGEIDWLEEEFVGYHYGAYFLSTNYDREKDNLIISGIKSLIDNYESQITSIFTRGGIKGFYNAIEEVAYNEVVCKMQCGGKPNEDDIAIKIKVGNHDIVVPYTDNNYCRLYDFLMQCREDTVDIKVETEKEKEKDLEKSKQNYVVIKTIDNSCYPSVFQSLFKLLLEKDIDGWYAIGFLKDVYETACKAEDIFYDTNNPTELYFAIYDPEEIEDEDRGYMKAHRINYGYKFEDCFVNHKILHYYRIHMTEDCRLEEIVPRVKTIDEQILETLLSYQMTNKDFLSEVHNKDLQDQIDYMRKKVEES